MTIGKICVCISLLFQLAAIVMLLHNIRQIKKAKERGTVYFGTYTYVMNAAVNLLGTYAIYSLTANKNINSILLPVVLLWLLGNIISGKAVYVSMIPKEWMAELGELIKYTILGQLLLLSCIIMLRLILYP